MRRTISGVVAETLTLDAEARPLIITLETHCYNALGRRVATHSQRGSGCVQDHTECFPYWERTVWDGDQLLYETRAATNYDSTPSGGSCNAYGRVVYLHGGCIDTPLAVTRMGLNGQPAEVTTAPHADW